MNRKPLIKAVQGETRQKRIEQSMKFECIQNDGQMHKSKHINDAKDTSLLSTNPYAIFSSSCEPEGR